MADHKALEESENNRTNEIDHSLIPDNSFTIILKARGKVYALGGETGKIKPNMADEDIDSTLRALNGAGLVLQRTFAVKVAKKPVDYPLPGDNAQVEENVAPKAGEEETGVLYVAGADIKKGQALHLTEDGTVKPINEEAAPEA